MCIHKLTFFLVALLYSFIAQAFTAFESRPPHIKFELIDNRIFVEAYVNDQGPFKFIFDTGGNNSMTFELANKLGLAVKAAGDGTGGGSGRQPVGKVKVRKFQVAGINLADQDFWVMDYSIIQKSFNLKALDGIFGYELLQNYLISIDFEKYSLTFFSNPSDFSSNGFEVINFDLQYQKPFIKTQIKGLAAHTLIDTGDRSALTVTKSFRKNGLIDRAFQGKSEIISGHGIGGPIPAQISTIGPLKITEIIQLHDVITRAPTSTGGFNAIEGLDASIGNDILKQFHLGLDYRKRMIYIKKNKNFGQATKFTPVPNP